MNCDIHLQIPKYYGETPKLFISYLSDRKQYTEIGNNLFNMEYIRCGVPEGSTLGPLLFLFYYDITESELLELLFFTFGWMDIATVKAETTTRTVLPDTTHTHTHKQKNGQNVEKIMIF